VYQAADNPAQEVEMDSAPQSSGRRPTPQDSDAAERLVATLTGMTPESAQTFMDFVSGMRWLRPEWP
jgi:hypothetical protein